MSEGFLAFKWIGWGAAGLLALATIAPNTSASQWNLVKSTMQKRPGLLKKTSASTGGTTTSTGTTSPTTSTSTSTTLPEMSIIPSNFDINSELVSSPLPQPDVVEGAFRFICNAGALRSDDPIVF